MNKIEHRNVVKLKGVHYTKFTFSIVMEFMEFDLNKTFDLGNLATEVKLCHSLSELLRQFRCFELQEVMAEEKIYEVIAEDCALGLQYLHQNNIVHRDIKPQNVLVSNCTDRKLVAKLCDFGEARSNLIKTQTLITTGLSKRGTMIYNGPEQFLNLTRDHSSLKQSDIWSLGALLYCLANPSMKGPWISELAEITQYEEGLKQLMMERKLPEENDNDTKIESLDGLRDIYKMCMVYEQSQRPTAEEIFQELKR